MAGDAEMPCLLVSTLTWIFETYLTTPSPTYVCHTVLPVSLKAISVGHIGFHDLVGGEGTES